MTIVIAHRGASAAAPENTLEAFRLARRLGADMVELDARRTADGAIAVRHDPVVAGTVPVHTLRAADLDPSIPLLEAAIDACEGMGVNVEVKNLPGEPDWEPDECVATAVARLVGTRGLHDRVLVSSFNLASLDRVRELDPAVPTAWLTLAGYDQAVAVATCAERGHVALHPEDRAVTPELVELAHRAGLRVNTWTVDDAGRMRELIAWGIDGICTNVPDVLVAVLADRARGARS